jgi:hypothetical protein
MPSFITPVENQPIVFSAFLQRITNHELEYTFNTLMQYIESKGRIVLILDVTCWDMTKEGLTSLVGALAIRQDGSPYDHNVVTLLICSDEVKAVLLESLTDHNAGFEMLVFPSLDLAYQFALAIWKNWKNLKN